MSYTVRELLGHQVAYGDSVEPESTIGNCAVRTCGKIVTERSVYRDDRGKVVLFENEQPIHNLCYYDKLGETIERYPFGLPGCRR